MVLIVFALVLLCAVCAFVFFIALLKTIEWLRNDPKDILSWISAGALLLMVLINIGIAVVATKLL